MITNKGIELLTKYVSGQVPAYASHIAIGSGAQPLKTGDSLGSYASTTELSFEMARFPIISRTAIKDGGVNYAVVTAEIPTADRYAFTEVGIYPAEKNNVAGSIASRILFSFTEGEDWQYHNVVGSSVSAISVASGSSLASQTAPFRLYSEDSIFQSTIRLNRQEQPRFLGSSVFMPGNMTALSGGNLDYTKNHVELNTGVDLSDLDNANSITDKIKVAFGVLATSEASPVTPTAIKLTVEFAVGDGSGEYARMILTPTASGTNRYYSSSSLIKDLTYSSTAFKWSNVQYIRIFGNVDTGTDNFIFLDGIRFENSSDIDFRYGLAGYTVIKNGDAGNTYSRPISKLENTTSYIEFKFKLGLV